MCILCSVPAPLSAVGALLSGAGQLVPAMQACMTVPTVEQRAVRAHATECMGILINSEGGKEALGAHIPAFMQVGRSRRWLS